MEKEESPETHPEVNKKPDLKQEDGENIQMNSVDEAVKPDLLEADSVTPSPPSSQPNG
jgi:hypothetical protein